MDYVTIARNTVDLTPSALRPDSSGAGIHVEDFCRFNTIVNNTIHGNLGLGIWCCEAAESLIKGNVIYDNGGGIGMSQAEGNHDNVICNNLIVNSTHNAIDIRREYYFGNTSTLVVGNSIFDSGQNGIFLGPGASANMIRENRIVGSKLFAVQMLSARNDVADNILLDNKQLIDNPQGTNNSVSLQSKPGNLAAVCPSVPAGYHPIRVYVAPCEPEVSMQRWQHHDSVIRWLGETGGTAAAMCLSSFYCDWLLDCQHQPCTPEPPAWIPSLQECASGGGAWKVVPSEGNASEIYRADGRGPPLCLATGGLCYGAGLLNWSTTPVQSRSWRFLPSGQIQVR
jgi:parallel beta-helix repeat protein